MIIEASKRTSAISALALLISAGAAAVVAPAAAQPVPETPGGSAAAPATASVVPARFGLTAAPTSEGYVLADRGRMIVRGTPRAERIEDFEVWTREDGSRLSRSVAAATDGRYRVEGEWRSDASGRVQHARGRGAIGEEPLDVQIEARPGDARIVVRRGKREPESITGSCTPDCLVDFAPQSMAMFDMTRATDLEAGKVREFRWIGHALNLDGVLVDGQVRFIRLGEVPLTRPDGSVLVVRHDVFVEFNRELRTGQQGFAFFNLWSDTQGRRLKFESSRAVGLREGYEDLAQLAPATLGQVFPDVKAP